MSDGFTPIAEVTGDYIRRARARRSWSVLTEADVVAIRASEGVSDPEWARRLNVRRITVYRARRGITWAELPGAQPARTREEAWAMHTRKPRGPDLIVLAAVVTLESRGAPATIRAVSGECGQPRRTVESRLQTLARRALIAPPGMGRSIGYRLTDAGRAVLAPLVHEPTEP